MYSLPKALILIGVVLLIAGCTGQQVQKLAGMLNPDARTFIYHPGSNATGPIARTVAVDAAINPGNAINVYNRSNLSVRDCLNLTDNYSRWDCLQSAAINLNDSSICAEDPTQAAGYTFWCYFDYAVANGDPTACGSANQSYNCSGLPSDQQAGCIQYKTSEVPACIRDVAVVTGNSSLCTCDPSETNGLGQYDLCLNISSVITPKAECRNQVVTDTLLTPYFGDSMQWLEANHPGSKVLAWWDYGSSLDCMGLQSVISNQNENDPEIPHVSYLLLDANSSELASYMHARGADYIMLDVELLATGGALGGKYGALDYLACAYANETTADQSPGTSKCEASNLWENIYISNNPCNVSANGNLTGSVAYELYADGVYTPYYPSMCSDPLDANETDFCKNRLSARPVYCVATTTLANGQPVPAPYYLNETDPSGNLKLDRAMLEFPQNVYTSDMGQVTEATLLYSEDPVWETGGNATSGYADRKGAFYDSNLYRGIFLTDLPGFKLVYNTSDQAVKIYEVQ